MVKKYIYNVDFFRKESVDLAYCLGFFLADGYIDKNGKYISIGLQGQDIEILNYFKNLIGGGITYENYIDRTRNKYTSNYKYKATCREIVNELYRYGFSNSPKTGKEFIPKIDAKFYPDFIRGYFDGDGCICYSKEKQYVTSICCSNRKFLEDISNIIPVKSSIYQKTKSPDFYDLMINAQNTVGFKEYIYYDENLFGLQRKKDKLLSCNISDFIHISFTDKEDKFIKDNYNPNDVNKSIKHIAKELNRTESSINHRASRLNLRKSLKSWTKNDIDYLLNNSHLSIEELAKKLDRTKGSISNKRWEINKCQAI